MSFTLDPVLSPLCFQDFIESGRGVRLRLAFPQKDPRNPLFRPEQPWEGACVVYPSVWICPDTGIWKMWYGAGKGFVCYAESRDGVAWTRPELGLVEFEGSKANNIVLACRHCTPCVYLDPKGAPEQRYRMAISETGQYQDEGGISHYTSPDGIHWTMLKACALRIRNDSQSPLVRHPKTGEWLTYHRPMFVLRTIACSISGDGLNWRSRGEVIAPDAIDKARQVQNYALSAFVYDGGFIGIMKQFATAWHDRRCWLELVVSRDGIEWQRLADRRPFVPLGDDGAWDSLCMTGGHGLVPEGDGHWFYYDCWNARHTDELSQPFARCCIGRAFIPRRRLMEAVAEGVDGWIKTVPCLLNGERLVVDGDAGETEVRGSVEYEDGTVPPGFAMEDSSVLRGRQREGVITFKGGSLKQFGRVPVRIRVHVQRGARVYAVGVT